VRFEALKVKFKGSLSFEFKKARWRTQNFTDEWWRDGEVFIELARIRGGNVRDARLRDSSQ